MPALIHVHEVIVVIDFYSAFIDFLIVILCWDLVVGRG